MTNDRNKEKPTVLVIDDTPDVLTTMTFLLRDKYIIKVANSGARGFKVAETGLLPDLILLDIMMPEMDGYEVCRRLKENDRLKKIPVIFISALDATEDIIKGFQVGGVDYITKPFQPEEVQARVGTHLDLHFYRNELEAKNRQLEDSYHSLQNMENLRDSLVHMVVHDMRNLLMGVSSYLEMMGSRTLEGFSQKAPLYLKRASALTDNLTGMTEALLDVSRLENNEMKLKLTDFDMNDLVEEAVEKLYAMKEDRNISFSRPERPMPATGDRDVLLRIIVNLLNNAIKFGGTNGTIVLKNKIDGSDVIFSISDDGPGVPDAYHEKIFEKFGQVEMRKKKRKYSTGLGLTFCKLGIEAHGGRIWLESKEGEGTTFFLRIPGKAVRQ